MKRAIVDLSSVIWTNLLGGKDLEHGRKVIVDEKEVLVNSAGYGYEKVIAFLGTVMDDLNVVPHQLILVMEGMNSKQNRLLIHSDYKSGRDKEPEQYEQFQLTRDRVIEVFRNLGAQICWQDGGVESDDVIGYLAQNLHGERWIVSGDKDLAAMVGGDIHHWRAGIRDENPFGPFPHRFIPVYIALVGDSGDKIPGAKGFGHTAFLELLAAFGDDGLELMEELIKKKQLGRLVEDVDQFKKLQKIIDDTEGVYKSYELGRLQVEKVNTMRRPLEWKVGMVKPRAQCPDERLRKHAGIVKLVHAGNYEAAKEWLRQQFELSPFVTLDVETSTPDASDEWLEKLDKKEGNVPVDVFGSELTSLQITLGSNLQFTIYMPIDNVEEPDVPNLTIAQVRDIVDMIPRNKITWVHNASFELPVCYMGWGKDWAGDELYHGFLRNVRDTAIASSYADENRSRGLKSLSKNVLDYEQATYESVTTREYLTSEWNGQGKVLGAWKEEIGGQPSGRFEKIERPTGKFTDEVVGKDHYGSPIYREIMETIDGPEIMDGTVEGPEHVKVQHKMNQLTARHCLSYGADDTICTAALAVHFVTIMELENTLHIFEACETYPAYLTALAFVQGTPFSLTDMAAMEKKDDAKYEAAWPVLRSYLMKIGFEGTVCPTMLDDKAALAYLMDNDLEKLPNEILEFNPKGIKAAFNIVTGAELKTLVKKHDKLAKLIEMWADDVEQSGAVDTDTDDARARALAKLVLEGNISGINQLMAMCFKGEPVLDLGSPTKMAHLLYDRMKLPINFINDVTPLQYANNRPLADAVKKFKQIRAGKSDLTMTPEEMALVRTKATADDDAVAYALAFDSAVIDEDAKAALRAIEVMRKVMTRRNLFYKNYWVMPHWKDGLIHASANQCAAVTRRYSMSNPNLQQLPKKGEGVEFRGCFKPHHKNAVICSIDFVGQELRLAAERSQDKNMLACYVGDKLKDIHSITASGAMKLKWGAAAVQELMGKHGDGLTDDQEGLYDLFLRLRELGKADTTGKKADDLRKDSKNVNFGAQNGAKAPKLSKTLIMPVADAQLFLDAREKMFPDVEVAAERAANQAKSTGYVQTFMGARRHLRVAMLSDERGAADRAARQAWNFEIQGSAGEMIKLAMSRMWVKGIFFKYDARFIAPVHDELVDSVSQDDAVEFIREKHWCMTQAYADMQVPILGSISIGPDFADQHECGDWFIEENIRKALNDIFTKEAQPA